MVRSLRSNFSKQTTSAEKKAGAGDIAVKGRRSAESAPDFALQCFDIDKAEVSARLYKLSHSLAAGAKEMEMIAAERVFDKSFSAKLANKAQVLRRLAQHLNRMHEQAARARFPGDQET
jgi:hypothetical protein